VAKSRQTLLVDSKTCGKTVLYTTFEGRETKYIPLAKLTPMVLEIDGHDFTNKVWRDSVG
jgi:hypothetical protein